ncbi:hypothetical protein BT63DRAFT_270332 [Microthyrium microscopicum]|uniref:Xylanolytic transcriptional activator regulatory domain-containing protein n=1 Tax=Microthyrium microscopicum TaxID=703497 RepID=A0A6A6U7E7_9PEZI|nr:hypothetical protein BT63DRAFT_270332 [Microthyrium microscopicum]
MARKKQRIEQRHLESAANQPPRAQMSPPHIGAMAPAPYNSSIAAVLNNMPTSHSNSFAIPAPVGPPPPTATAAGTATADESMTRAARSLQQFSQFRASNEDRTKSFLSIVSNLSGQEGEALVYSQSRMLEDSNNRLLYIGDSATLAFIGLLRNSIEPLVPGCDFVSDPRRHMITEPQLTVIGKTPLNNMFPTQSTAKLLTRYFFLHTAGMVTVFDQEQFYNLLERTYSDPLAAESENLCLINLVFAIGFMLATPEPGSEEAEVIEGLKNSNPDRGEIFYINAKSQCDPQTGLEDADFWSCQALLLMTIFMMTKGKRNTAFVLLGMAIRSAYALGLHREECLRIFDHPDQLLRRNCWKSLFNMDRFLSLSMGRPTAIFEDEIYGHASPRASISSGISDEQVPSPNFIPAVDPIDVASRVCSAIGIVLKKTYQQKRVSTAIAQDIASLLRQLDTRMPLSLRWQDPHYPKSPNATATMHVNLFLTHSVILLTRPFFLYVLNHELSRLTTVAGQPLPAKRRGFNNMMAYSEACVSAATHTVAIVRGAYDAKILPRRNPLVVYFLSSAAFILLSNDFCKLHKHGAAAKCIRDAFEIMDYCGNRDHDGDEQADRLVYIMKTLSDAVDIFRGKQDDDNQLPPMMPSGASNGDITPLPSAQTFGAPGPYGPGTGTPFHTPFQQPSSPFSQAATTNYTTTASIPPNYRPVGKSTSSTPTPLEPLAPSGPNNPLSPIPNRTPLPAAALNSMNYNINNGVAFPPLLEFADSFNTGDNMSIQDDGSNAADEHIDLDSFYSMWQPGPVMQPTNGNGISAQPDGIMYGMEG